MDKSQIRSLIDHEGAYIADLLETHQDIIEENETLCKNIRLSRKTIEFFMQVNNLDRVLYDMKLTKKEIMDYLGFNDM
tara:strand:+ start:320 stop:553 length:234 start_codon:yes stop_codon:yes gene_type:complete